MVHTTHTYIYIYKTVKPLKYTRVKKHIFIKIAIFCYYGT